MRRPWKRREEPQNVMRSIADPTLVEWFTPGGAVDTAGVTVSETTALGLSAFYRAISLISGTLATLPFRSYTGEGPQKRAVSSIFDNPDGDEGQTPYEWLETAFVHLLMHGEAGALKVRTEAGALARLPLVHPASFRVEEPTLDEYRSGELPAGGRWFVVQLNDGTQARLDSNDFWYVPGLSLDGMRGVSLLTYARLSLGTAVAGDKAAARMFSKGALISGLATPDYDSDYDISEDIPKLRQDLDRAVGGHENAGRIAIVSRKLKLQPWSMSAVDAQFLQSRQFSVEEVARWTGVPPHLLMQTEKQTSWGTGVDEQNRGLSKFVLGPWAQRFEQRASRLLARPRWCEFDFAGLERPNFATEIDLLIKQVQAGLLTLDEARAIRNLPPLPESAQPADQGGDDAPAE